MTNRYFTLSKGVSMTTLTSVPHVLPRPAVRQAHDLDSRQRHVALAIASGDLDAHVARLQAALRDLDDARNRFLVAVSDRDRENAHEALTAVAGAIARIGDDSTAMQLPQR